MSGETKSYLIPCEEGQVIDVVVDQRGVDAIVALKDPNGRVLSEVDGFFGASGKEKILELIPLSGACFLEVIAGEGLHQEGHFTVRIERQQEADLNDRQKVDAARLYWQGFRLEMTDELQPAVEKYKESLARWIELGNREWQSIVHYTLGQVYANKMRYTDTTSDLEAILSYGQPYDLPRQYEPTIALQHLKASLELSDDDLGLEARAHYNIGDVYSDLIQLDQARASYGSALSVWERLGDRSNQAATLNNLGFAHKQLGELQAALQHYDTALSIWRDLDRLYEEAIALHNRGTCYTALNRTDLAASDLERAIEIWNRINAGDALLATSYTAMGELLGKTGRFEEAHLHLNRALELRASNRLMQAVTRFKLGAVEFAQGNRETAGEYYQQSLEVFREFGNKRGEAEALFKLGELKEAGEPDEALELHNKALEIGIGIGSRDLVGRALFGVARAERHRGHLDTAKRYIEEAVAKVEFMRNNTAGNELRSVFFSSKQQYYDFYIDLLMELSEEHPGEGYDALALSISERSRARTLLDILSESSADLRRGDDSALLDKELMLERAIEVKYLERSIALSSGAARSSTEKSLSAELKHLLRSLDEVRSELQLQEPTYADITQLRTIGADYIQNYILTDDTVLLEYHLGDPNSFLFVLTKNGLSSYRLPARGDLEARAQNLHEILTGSPEETTLNRGRLYVALDELSQEILHPAASMLEGKRLLIVADGALQYVPFGALPLPSGTNGSSDLRLVDNHEITFLPSASILKALRKRFEDRPKAPMNLAVVADPVFFDDPRLTKSEAIPGRTRDLNSVQHQRLERLTFSRHEAEYILAQAGGDDNLLALGFNATKEQVMDDALRNYRFVHLATHSIVDAEFPDMSSLIFSFIDQNGENIDGFLRVNDVYKLDLQAEMVVLSACKTIKGKDIRGEGLVGWTHGFMYSGAKRVLVSLWDVDDEATAELMSLVYGYIFKHGLSPATALHNAQSELRRRPRWREPYFWAGFVLQGEYL